MSCVQKRHRFQTVEVKQAKLYLDDRLALKQTVKNSLELPC